MARFRKAIINLGLALLNATLLLALALGVVLLLVLNKTSDLIVQVEDVASNPVSTILGNNPLLEEIDQLRENLATANRAIETGASADLAALSAQLEELEALLQQDSSQRSAYIKEITRAAVEGLISEGVSGASRTGAIPSTSE